MSILLRQKTSTHIRTFQKRKICSNY